MADTPFIIWVAFNVFVLLMLALDLGVFHRQAHEVRIREALAWSAVWVALALIFNGVIWWWKGHTPALEFFTGYLLEKALSVDNLFVFLLLFRYFKIPAAYQHRVLFWGILGALIMRALFIAAGITLIQRFHWMLYVFGAFLVFTGLKMWFAKDEEADPSSNLVLRFCRRWLPVTHDLRGQRFVVREQGRTFFTPLFVVLLLLETTDVIFALDSIPAIIAVTKDPFLVYTSNIFAILGLRALYFALSGVLEMFHFLHHALAFVLVFIGVKMLIEHWYDIPILWSLAVIATALAVAVVASLLIPKKENV